MDDDPELPRRLALGEAAAFDQLVASYGSRVTALTHRLLGWQSGEVDDVVQEVFVAALQRCRHFRGDSSLWTWLTAITLNRCRSQWRRRAVRRILGRVAVEPAADAPAIADETSAQVRQAVAALPGRLREVIVLYYLQEMSVREIGQALGLTQTAIDVRLHRGRQKLRDGLAQLREQLKR